jgi:hypothetical protein
MVRYEPDDKPDDKDEQEGDHSNRTGGYKTHSAREGEQETFGVLSIRALGGAGFVSGRL